MYDIPAFSLHYSCCFVLVSINHILENILVHFLSSFFFGFLMFGNETVFVVEHQFSTNKAENHSKRSQTSHEYVCGELNQLFQLNSEKRYGFKLNTNILI